MKSTAKAKSKTRQVKGLVTIRECKQKSNLINPNQFNYEEATKADSKFQNLINLIMKILNGVV